MLGAVGTPGKMPRSCLQASAGNRNNPLKQSTWGQGSKERGLGRVCRSRDPSGMMMGGRVWDGVRTGEGASEGKNYNKDQEEEMAGGGR